ncbi:MAG: hypothetical protein L0Z50_18190 [Verrucomicrobiales bacterium]|nr:hypothetical protein [Verrucomicrobiales bacterium]
MSTNKKRIAARFAPETRFEVTPTATAPFRAILETEFERLQKRLLKDVLNRTIDPDLNLLFRHASTEAAALAAAAGYPLLLLPLLFEEKVEAARLYSERQARILKRGSEPTGVAA